jgi:radical SAM superfamily enzyme YgiQ (UPF0313 family)
MKLVLVDNLVMPEEGALDLLDVHPHLGLLALAAAAERDGHRVTIYDPKRSIRNGKLPYDATLYERVARDIAEERPDAVGFTTLGCSFLLPLNVAALLKRREPDLPVLLGGPHATMLHREILERFRQFDLVVRYEADETFAAVLDQLERRNFSDIPGIAWRGPLGVRVSPGAPKVEDLDRLPLLPYDHYPVRELNLDLMRIEAGRGCPFQCTFCSTASFFQRSFRMKSAGRLLLELERLKQLYGATNFKLDHDMFTVNRRKVLEFCEAVTGRGFRWRASARMDCVDQELLEKMATAGCVELYFGIETGSRRMQDLVKKRLDLSLVEPTLNVTDRLQIATTVSFITGYPQELQADQDDTLDLIGRCLAPSRLPQLHLLAPEPGTPLLAEHGATLDYDGYAGPFNARVMLPSDEAAIVEHQDIFATYYHYQAALPRAHHLRTVQLMDVLRRLSPRVLRYALRAFDGRLSQLAAEVFQAADADQSKTALGANEVLHCITNKLGPRHHLTSLFRYSFEVHASAPATKDFEAVFDPRRRYRLNPNARVLHELHDIDHLLKLLESEAGGSALADDASAGELGTHLIVTRGRETRTYRIDPGIAAILEMFESPRSCRDVARRVRRRTGQRIDDTLEALAQIAAIEQSTEPALEARGAAPDGATRNAVVAARELAARA